MSGAGALSEPTESAFIHTVRTGEEPEVPARGGVPVSFIIPAYNASSTLAATIESIRDEAPADSEVIVVDDGSFDETVQIANRLADRVVTRPCQGGAARARNDGALVSRGDVLIFVDSDVTVTTGAIPGLLARIADGADAVFGAYQALPPPEVRNVPTTYKNLLHHYTHRKGAGEAWTFWSGFGGVRREAFSAVRGFDPSVTTAADVEDIHLGYRLRQAGFRIVLDPTLEVTHHKRYTVGGLIDSDLFHRAIPWTRAMLELRSFQGELNLGKASVLSSFFAYLTLASLVALPLAGVLAGVVLAGSLSLWVALNLSFLSYLSGFMAARTTVLAWGLHFLYYIYGPFGGFLGVIAYLLRHEHDSFLNQLALESEHDSDSIAVTVAIICGPNDPSTLRAVPVPDETWELLVVGVKEPEGLPAGARFVPVSSFESRNQLRDLSLAEARGRMLALLDAQHSPAPEWLERVMAASKRPDIAVGGSFAHDRRGLIERAYQVARYWQWRPERKSAWLVDHPASNLVVRTSVARALGGFSVDGALLLRLAGFGARPLRFDPAMEVDLLGDVAAGQLTRGLAGISRLRAAASVRYHDIGLSARLMMVLISPVWAMAGLYYLIRSAVRERSAERTFWLALPISLIGAASFWLGRNWGALWPGDRGGVVPHTESEIAELASRPVEGS